MLSKVGMFFACLALSAGLALADADKYSDSNLTVEWTRSGDNFTGTITLGAQKFPVTGHASGANVSGAFTSGASQFPFTGTLNGEALTLTTGGKAYNLAKVQAPNPLGANDAPNPLGAGTSGGKNLPAGYSVVISNDAGQSLLVQKAGPSSMQNALQSTLDDLRGYFGSKISVGRGYQNAGDKNAGGATFTSTMDGKPIRGIVSCKLNNGSATVAVIYCRSDASNTQWTQLMNPPANSAPAQPVQPAPAAPAAAAAPDPDAAIKSLGSDVTVYQYPDGTGSIAIPQGWKTQATSAVDPIIVTGPEGRSVFINVAAQVFSKDSQRVKMMQQTQAMQQQNARQMQRMGVNLPPPPPAPKQFLLQAEFTDPVQALNDLTPQLSDMNQSRGLPTLHIDKILDHKDQTSPNPTWKVSIVEWLVTHTTTDGKSQQFHSQALLSMAPGLQGSGAWLWMQNGMTCPAETWDHDHPIMMAIMKSQKLNQQAMAQVSAQRTRQIQQQGQQDMAMLKQQADASNAQLQANHEQFMQQQQERFDQGQAAHQAQLDSYAQHNAQFQQDELAKARNKDDFVETIQGTRTIYDTQTGNSAKVDLGSASAIVDDLNQQTLDPNRFIQVPLRDEQDPLPAGR